MRDRLDVQPYDLDVLDEIELVTELMIAASASPDRFKPEQLDRLLGLRDDEQTEDRELRSA